MPQFTIRYATLEDAAALADLSCTPGYPSSVQEARDRLGPITRAQGDSALVARMRSTDNRESPE